MFKNLLVLMALLVICLMSGTAVAGDVALPLFKINVPDGWTATLYGEDSVGIVADDKTASMSITVNKMNGSNLEDIANKFSRELKGTKPKRDESGYYRFTFTSPNGVTSRAGVAADKDNNYALIVTTGAHPQMEEIMRSLERR